MRNHTRMMKLEKMKFHMMLLKRNMTLMIVATLALGSQPKQRGLQGCELRGSPGVTPHAPRNVGKCEGMNPHIPNATPTLGDGVSVDPRIFKRWAITGVKTPESCKVITLNLGIIYIIGKSLEHRCLKWARMTHLDI